MSVLVQAPLALDQFSDKTKLLKRTSPLHSREMSPFLTILLSPQNGQARNLTRSPAGSRLFFWHGLQQGHRPAPLGGIRQGAQHRVEGHHVRLRKRLRQSGTAERIFFKNTNAPREKGEVMCLFALPLAYVTASWGGVLPSTCMWLRISSRSSRVCFCSAASPGLTKVIVVDCEISPLSCEHVSL